MDLRGRLTRIVVEEDAVWVTVLYPRKWVGDPRHVKFPVSFALSGIPDVEIRIYEDPKVEVSMSELARDVADTIYDEIVETVKAKFSDHGSVQLKKTDVFINSDYELVRRRNRLLEAGILEVGGTVEVIFVPPMSPDEFKEWIDEKLKFMNEEFPYIVEDAVGGAIISLVFATLETNVRILRKASFTVPRTEIPSKGPVRNLSPFFTVSFKITGPEEVLDAIKKNLSRAKNEKEALKTLSFYLSMFSDVITTTSVSTTDEDEYDDLAFEIHERTGGRTSLGEPRGLAFLLTRILEMLG